MKISSLRKSTLIELAIFLAIISTACADDMIPYFTEEPTSAILSQSVPVVLSCHAHPQSAVVRWTIDGETLDANHYPGIELIETDLHIAELPEDTGDTAEFQCTAQTTFGIIVSKPASVAKAVLRKFEDRGDLHFNVSQGSNVVLPCQPPYSRPLAKVMYRYNTSSIIDKDTDHYKLLPSGNLQIIRLTSNDTGQYQCLAENKLRNRTHAAKHIIHINVINTKVSSRDVAVDMPTTKQFGTVGDSVVLECSAVGNPQPAITWEKYGGELIPGRYKQLYGNLFLENVTKKDEGTYLCKANNGLNSLNVDGLKALQLEISEPPTVIAVQMHVNISLGGLIELQCIVSGKPEPKVTWLHNGNILKAFNEETKLIIQNGEGKHEGLYQCFAENEAGIQYTTMAVHVDVTKRDSGSLTLSDQNVVKTPSGGISDVKPAGQENGRRRHKKKKKKKGNNKRRDKKGGKTRKLEKNQLVPPSRPEVKQLSDTSVMLNWTVQENEGLQITFFRVQYKRVGSKKSAWKTEDKDIDRHIRVSEVQDLAHRATYKFRIAAVYSNNDNAHGPNSDRFEMKLDLEPKPRAPGSPPTIVEVLAVENEGDHALNIAWQQNKITPSLIEGFYIYYKPYYAEEEFQNQTLYKTNIKSHLIKGLIKDTSYLIKMQSFNSAGKSPFSNEVVKQTKGTDGPYQHGNNNPNFIKPGPGTPTDKPGTNVSPVLVPAVTYPDESTDSPSKADNQSSSEMLYMILGIVLGVMMLLLIVFMFMCWWKQRQQRRLMDAMNDAVRNKFQDPSQRIYADSLRKKMVNGGLNGVNGTIANGHIPRNYHKMNINVNPLSEMDGLTSTDGSNHYSPTAYQPNGSLPGHLRASDNNCNNINQSKSLENSLHHQQSAPSSGETDDLGGGESLANPPSPTCSMPIGHCTSNNSEHVAHERRSISSRSTDQVSCDHGDSTLSYDDTGGVHGVTGRHRKRRRRHTKEQTTKDQATNTDLSSNDGTMDLAEYNKAISSSQDSGQMGDHSPVTFTPSMTDNHVLVPCTNAV